MKAGFAARATAAASRRLVADEAFESIEREVGRLLAPSARHHPMLAAAVADTLARPGSLWRAQLAWAVARAHGATAERALALAAGIEAFHTASLLFDDLPAMDDGELRRGRPCAHRVHGEAAAILAALAFVHRGYARLWQAMEEAPPALRRRASSLVEACLGLDGILDGQARDVHYDARRGSAADVLAIAAGKTVTLLRLSLVLPALLGGSPPRRLERFERLARGWGLAYQILDDLAEPADGARGDDARCGRPNLALAAGPDAARARLLAELAAAEPARLALSAALPSLTLPFARLAARFEREASPLRWRMAGGTAA